MAKNDRRRFGDRKDGRLLRSLPAYTKFMPYIMATRNDALNLYEESMEITDVDRRLRRLRVDGYKGIGFLHFLIGRQRHHRRHDRQARPVHRRDRDQHQGPF